MIAEQVRKILGAIVDVEIATAHVLLVPVSRAGARM
jgi:hypothetical protein